MVRVTCMNACLSEQPITCWFELSYHPVEGGPNQAGHKTTNS
jgi:hypothetical protein